MKPGAASSSRTLRLSSLLLILWTTKLVLSQDLALQNGDDACVGIGKVPDTVYNVTCTLEEGSAKTITYSKGNFCQSAVRFTCSTASGVASCFLFRNTIYAAYHFSATPAQRPRTGSYIAGCFQQSNCDQIGQLKNESDQAVGFVVKLHVPTGSSNEVKYSLECLAEGETSSEPTGKISPAPAPAPALPRSSLSQAKASTSPPPSIAPSTLEISHGPVSPSTSGLSKRTIGIIVGSTAAVCFGFLLLTALIIVRRKRRRSKEKKSYNAFNQPFDQESKSTVLQMAPFEALEDQTANAQQCLDKSGKSTFSIIEEQSILCTRLADVDCKLWKQPANLPSPSIHNGSCFQHGIQTIAMDPSLSMKDGLSETWRIKPQDLQICMRRGVPIILGEGGYGKVYLGVLHRGKVAIKMVTSHTTEQQNQFIKEIRTLRACHNYNIVQFMGACVKEGQTIMAMQYMSGGNLYKRISADTAGHFGWYIKGHRIAMDIAKGLVYLHSQSIAHLDLKSPNIMLTANDDAKIGDVGLGKIVANSQTFQPNGCSFMWAAPEQLQGGGCNTASDIWAFGTVLWEICTLQVPTNRQMRALHIPDEAPQQVADLIDHCHEIKKELRPTATQVYDLLSSL